MSILPIYLDNSATTPVDPRVVDKMVPWLYEHFGNPASRSHAFGWEAEEAVENARAEVAKLVNADPREIVWTSGATESDNLAIKGAANFYAERGKHIITVKTEHKAVLDTCRELERQGFEVTYLDVQEDGLIDLDVFKAALRPDTILVSVMMVNNEVGVVQDVEAIGEICREKGIIFHVDAAQSTGKVVIDLQKLKVDLMSFSAHKTYGPKGIGALYVRRKPRVRIEAQMHGGGHERGFRSGTLATHQIVGMGTACELAMHAMTDDNARIARLSRRLLDGVLGLDGVVHNAAHARRIPHTLSLTLGHPGFHTFMLNGNLAVSSTSACNSASGRPSHVLSAIGLDAEAASRTVRVSFGRFTNEASVDFAVACFERVVCQCRALAA